MNTTNTSTTTEIAARTADNYGITAQPFDARGWAVWSYMYSITRLIVSERVARAVIAAAPSLTFAQVEVALRAAHKIDRAGGSDAEVRIACYPAPTANLLIDAMRFVRGEGATLRLPRGVVVRYAHEAPQGLPCAPAWYSATIRGVGPVRSQDRDQMAAVLAAWYADQ